MSTRAWSLHDYVLRVLALVHKCSILGLLDLKPEKELNSPDLPPNSTKFITGDGRTIRPLGIACNINVIVSRKCIPTDFFVTDAYHSNHDHIILGRPIDAVLDAGEGKVTINLNGKKYT
jgi:hypothetical protein